MPCAFKSIFNHFQNESVNLYLPVNTFNLFSLYGLGLRYIEYRLIERTNLAPLGVQLNNLIGSFKQSCFTLSLWGVNDHVPDILGIILRDGHDQSTRCRRTPVSV
uniref:Uncharacterized protein n=1 Tax=Helianthus annuus TaxID=4232 RepID=A0A251UM94_HELAN